MSKTAQSPGVQHQTQATPKTAKHDSRAPAAAKASVTLPPLDPASTSVHSQPPVGTREPPVQMARTAGITSDQLEEAQHFAKAEDGTLTLPKNPTTGKAIPSKQSASFNAMWDGTHRDVQGIRKQIGTVGAKLDNRNARAEQAKADQQKRRSRWYRAKKAAYKGGMRTVGGIGGAAGGAVAGAPLGPGAIGTAVAGGAVGGGLAGAAAGLTWNRAEKGTDLVAAGRERELASGATRMAPNGPSTQSAAAIETGKDVALGVVTGGLSPLIGFGGDMAAAAAGEGGGGVAAEAFSSSAMSATAKEGTDLAYDKATGVEGPSLAQRGANLLGGTLVGAATGSADESDATASTNDGLGDLHQWQGNGGEGASDGAYGVTQEAGSGAIELGTDTGAHTPTSKNMHQVARKVMKNAAKEKGKQMMLGKAAKAKAEVKRRKEQERHDELLPAGRHNSHR
mgnify:CR=1 FL=1